MASCELVTLVTALACSITKVFTKDETAILAAVLTQLGDTLATIAVNDEIGGCNSDEE